MSQAIELYPEEPEYRRKKWYTRRVKESHARTLPVVLEHMCLVICVGDVIVLECGCEGRHVAVRYGSEYDFSPAMRLRVAKAHGCMSRGHRPGMIVNYHEYDIIKAIPSPHHRAWEKIKQEARNDGSKQDDEGGADSGA